MSDEGLTSETGEILGEFSLGKAVLLDLANERFNDVTLDERIGAIRIDAKRHECRIILFNNGKGIVLGQKSKRVIDMAISYWKNLLEEENVKVLNDACTFPKTNSYIHKEMYVDVKKLMSKGRVIESLTKEEKN